MKLTRDTILASNIRRYTKKFVAGLLSAVFFAACCPIAFAAGDSDGLYVSTEMCPAAVIDHAKEDFRTMNFQDWGVPGPVKLGTPFVLNVQNNDKLYYFPILNSDDEIVMTYRAYKNGDSYGGIFSEALVDELSEFETATTRSDPVKISLNPKLDIVLQSNRHVVVSKSKDASAATEAVQLKSSAANDLSKTPVNVLSVLCTNTGNSGSQLRAISDNRFRDIPVTIRETQGNNSWCAGYVAAMIVSYKTKNVYYARDVANYAGVSTNEGISRSKVISFAKSKGLSPRETIFDLSTQSIRNHINDDDPIYMGAIDIAHGKAHAFAITGYLQNINSGDISRFRVWNPWYDYFETIGLDQVYITDRGDRYEGERYIINW